MNKLNPEITRITKKQLLELLKDIPEENDILFSLWDSDVPLDDEFKVTTIKLTGYSSLESSKSVMLAFSIRQRKKSGMEF